MSLKTLTEEELNSVAEQFAVDFSGAGNVQEKIAALVEDGVTWEMYKSALPKTDEVVEVVAVEPVIVEVPVTPAPVFKEKEQLVLIKMLRQNPSYEIRGYKFTKQHPYAAVKESDVEWLLRNQEGFRQATPEEIDELKKSVLR